MRRPRILRVEEKTWTLKRPFRIARGSKSEAHTLRVEVHDGGFIGIGEAVPYPRYGESVASVRAQLTSWSDTIASELTESELLARLPAGTAKSALDCALLDAWSQRAKRPVHELLELPPPTPHPIATTLGVDTPEAMAKAAAHAPEGGWLKLKVNGDQDVAKVAAVRAECPERCLIVDANESWTLPQYVGWVPKMRALGVALIEQPFPADEDQALEAIERPVPICADESLHEQSDLERIAERYDAVNVKLDKAGGLRAGLSLINSARGRGLKIMLGCMLSSSLSIAPALILAHRADWIDLDGPLWLKDDYPLGVRFESGTIQPANPDFWGHGNRRTATPGGSG